MEQVAPTAWPGRLLRRRTDKRLALSSSPRCVVVNNQGKLLAPADSVAGGRKGEREGNNRVVRKV